MASPQIENGYTRIANELLEAFCSVGLPKNAGQIWWFILRKTYGWDKKEDLITFKQIREGTNILTPHISRELVRLTKANMIVTQMGNNNLQTYGIQKDYEAWKPLPKRVTGEGVTQMGNNNLQTYGIQKDYEAWKPLPKRVTGEGVTQMGSKRSQMGNRKVGKEATLKDLPLPKEKKEIYIYEKKEIDDELIDSLKAKYNHLDIDFERERYEHHQAEKKPGKKHKDKKRGFRNWVKQAEKWRLERASPGKGHVSVDKIMEERRKNGIGI